MPRPSGYSPVQLMFGRAQRTIMPKLPIALQPIDMAKAMKDRQDRDHATKNAFDSNSHDLQEISVGDRVLTQDISSKK